jgi:hypothetical protein
MADSLTRIENSGTATVLSVTTLGDLVGGAWDGAEQAQTARNRAAIVMVLKSRNHALTMNK